MMIRVNSLFKLTRKHKCCVVFKLEGAVIEIMFNSQIVQYGPSFFINKTSLSVHKNDCEQ